MTEDVLAGDQTSNEPNPVEELVGEGKKFKTVEDLARSKKEADAFIEQLKQEKETVLEEFKKLKEKDEKGETLEELLKEVRASKDKPSEDQEDGSSLEERVKAIIQGESVKATAEQNRELGNKLVLDKVGGDSEAAKSFLAERAREMGVPVSKLRELSESSPKLFAKAIDVDLNSKNPSVSSLSRDVNTTEFRADKPMHIDGVPTKAYFDQVKKEMGRSKYALNSKIQHDYLKAAMKLGSKFDS